MYVSYYKSGNDCRLILGYTYPAFECYKTVEKNKVDIEELRFWCQYWYLQISSFNIHIIDFMLTFKKSKDQNKYKLNVA